MARASDRRRPAVAPCFLRTALAASLACLWSANAAAAAFMPGQPTIAVDTQSGGGEPARDAFTLMMAPIRYWGVAAIDLRLLDSPTGGRTTSEVLSATINAATFVWQPWFMQVTGSAGVVGAVNQSDQSGSSDSISGIGSINIGVFPTSRFPFNLYADVNDSRASGQLTDVDYRSRRFRVSQSYSPQFASERYYASYEQSTLTTIDSGIGAGINQVPTSDVLQVLNLAASRSWEQNSLDGSVSVSRNEREEGNVIQRTRLDFANLQHVFLPGPSLSLNSNLSYTRTAVDAPQSLTLGIPLPGRDSSSDFTQLSSFATFRPPPGSRFYSESNRLLGTATFRAFEFGNSVDGTSDRSKGATGSVGLNYYLTPQTQLFSTTQAAYFTGDIEASSVAAQTFGITFSSQPIPLGQFTYTWGLGASETVGVVNGGSNDGFNHLTQATASQSFHRPIDLGPGRGALSFGFSQSIGYSFGSYTDAAGVLTNTITGFWNSTGNGATQAFAGLTASDSRRSGEFAGYYQLVNLQANVQMATGRWSSLQAGVTLQATRSEDEFIDTRPFDPFLDAAAGQWQTSYAAHIAYSHGRAFGVPRLVYTGLFQASSFDYDSRALGNVDAPLFKVDWLFENRLEYRIGRLLLLGTVRLAEVQNRGTNFSVFARAQRSFGAL